jgi:glutamate dehydrogenase
VEALDLRISAETQVALLLDTRRLVERATRWLLRERRRPIDVAATAEHFGDAARSVAGALPGILVDADLAAWDAHVTAFADAGVPHELAARAASLGALYSSLDVADVADAAGADVADVAPLHFRLGARLQLPWLRDRIAALPRDDRWKEMARSALRDDCFALHAELTADALRVAPSGDAEARLRAWGEANAAALERCLAVLADIRASGTYDLTTLPVALRELRTLVRQAAPVEAGAAG